MTPTMIRRFAPLILLALVTTGCGTDGPKMKPVFPVRGSVFVNDKPATGAMVLFHPLPLEAGRPTALRSRATVEADGSFRMTTYNTDDGAPEGEYAVTVYWPAKPGEIPDAEGPKVDTGAESSAGLPADRLGLRYHSPSSSRIKVRVSGPETTLPPFKLR